MFGRVEPDESSGFGEGLILRHFIGEATRTTEHLLADVLAPRVVRRPVTGALAAFRSEADRVLGHPTAKTALDGAARLEGQGVRESARRSLGGPRRDEVALTFLAGACPVELVDDDVAAAFDISVGMAANLHLAAVLPRLSSAAEICEHTLV